MNAGDWPEGNATTVLEHYPHNHDGDSSSAEMKVTVHVQEDEILIDEELTYYTCFGSADECRIDVRECAYVAMGLDGARKLYEVLKGLFEQEQAA